MTDHKNDHESSSARFTAGITNLLVDYESRLRQTNSTLVRDTETWASCRAHAEIILSVCARSIVERALIDTENQWRTASDIGTRRAALNIHPLESLRAGAVLVELITRLAEQAVATDPEPVALLSTVMLTLNRTIGSGMQFASISYDRFVFEQIKRTQEEARRAMARHVHDHVGNGVSLAYRQLELYDELRDRDGDTAHDRVTSARRALAEMLLGTRRLVSDLLLTEVSVPLSSAIDAFVKSAGVSSTVVDVEVSGDERRMSADLSSELFIVIREALRNTFKHADASRITVSVQVGMWQATASVADNGVGFDATRPDGGHGLALMTERVRLLGGDVHIRSKPDLGTRVEVSLPLSEAGHARAS